MTMETETSTAGWQLNTHRRWLAESVELLSSMRFAISLLTLISIASVIGTVLKQGEPMSNYVNQFGPFWFELFGKLGLYSVYSAWWFLVIMGFLVISTSLCLIRNTPKMLRDMRSWRDNVREQSLRNFPHRTEWQADCERDVLVAQTVARIGHHGYRAKVIEKDGGTLIAARKGTANKWGYIFAHASIVIICVGGLLDSDLPIRFQKMVFDKSSFAGNGLIAEIPAEHRLGVGNPSFRGNTMIPEGGASSTAIIPQADGVLIQDLPFSIQLSKFIIEYYSTGMPKLFVSEVTVTDHENGHSFPATIKVNEPLIYRGMAVYQSSFEDGGSRLQLRGYPMRGSANKPFELTGEVGGATELDKTYGDHYSIEWSGFRPFNVENMMQDGQDVRAVNPNQGFNQRFTASLDRHLGSAAKMADVREFKNVGPSVQYKLRDRNGQAREYHNYMQPVEVDGAYVFLAGMRESPSEPFRFLRIPADDNDSVDEWMRLRNAILTPSMREKAAAAYARRALPDARAAAGGLRDQLQASALRGLTIFAGDDNSAGYVAVSQFLERIPPQEQEKAADIFMKILNGSLWDLWQLARQQDGLAPMVAEERHGRFLQLAANAYSDAFFYGSPVYLQLQGFEEVKASVFQITRSPGKNIVYLGCLLLTLGVFSMFYIRERRMWVWIKSDTSQSSHAIMAMSTQRQTLDFEKEFGSLQDKLTQPSSR
ncbi:MAG: cytochrome c biogenesis protein ResB [Oxalicibacterium faecigallinarum]|uniref:cytochrome c biogenesis protein ResB n=1 Tax=Oxalicibacterium faecigallinarum TaxID=573741 RepID=UPI0028096502|nr:cytochrome c biogenesis protein ResB [Oxalicibacterium faecigallinarum]MDQ7968580.1 cytochrome c biogenesis protein ResB [Oxalicibacterium faecigallinarum]